MQIFDFRKQSRFAVVRDAADGVKQIDGHAERGLAELYPGIGDVRELQKSGNIFLEIADANLRL